MVYLIIFYKIPVIFKCRVFLDRQRIFKYERIVCKIISYKWFYAILPLFVLILGRWSFKPANSDF